MKLPGAPFLSGGRLKLGLRIYIPFAAMEQQEERRRQEIKYHIYGKEVQLVRSDKPYLF
ncbi:hypothetical protein YSY43_36610 [Paenibacillus sp. YSY-4.3]